MSVSFSTVVSQFKGNATTVRQEFNCPVLLWEGRAQAVPERDLEVTANLGIATRDADQKQVFRLIKANNPANAMSLGITVGRVPTNDVTLEDQSVSRFHAYFQFQQGTWTLTDTGSLHGTYIGEHQLKADERAVLADGAVVRFGGAVLKFMMPDTFFQLLGER